MAGPSTFKALNAVTATGAGAWNRLGSARSLHSMQVTVTGAPSALLVDLEGTSTVDGNGDPTLPARLATWDLAGGPNASGDYVVASNAPVEFIRANVRTLTGGTSPTITAEITSKDA